MATRSRRSQTRHDREVKKIAENLKRGGFKVAADIRGFSKPGTIGGYRPDVVAQKQGQRRIVEVETRESAGGARAQGQQRAFRQAARRSRGTKFTRVIVDG